MQSPLPTITAAIPNAGQPAATLGTNVTVQGVNLTGAAGVVLTNALRNIQQTIPCSVDASGRVLTFAPPKLGTPAELVAGIYDLAVQVPWMSGTVSTNSLPFAIAPDISTWSPGVLTSGSNNLTVPCTPFLQPGQELSLIIGDQQAVADAFTAATNSPTFTYANLQPTNGAVPARMRVDGIDSPIINMSSMPPTFSGPTVTVT